MLPHFHHSIPADARPTDVIILAKCNDFRIPKKSILEKRVEEALKLARSEIKRAAVPLAKYGVTRDEIVSFVAEKISFDDDEGLYSVLFDPRLW